ncbi:MAG: DUF5606 domain-containing protein [Bacteroidales bacterium]|nr:DUF5606 domain-containing protein [Bacteroidales bacterium]
MDLTKIVTISGKPGLYRMISETKHGMVVESMQDNRKFTVFSHERVSALQEISIYTDSDEVALKTVFKAIFDKENGGPVLSHKSDENELKSYFEGIVGNYDRDRVYISDIRKVLHWYNILQEMGLLDFAGDEAAEGSGNDEPEAKEGNSRADDDRAAEEGSKNETERKTD